MSPVTHALTGWTLACALPLHRRERGLITLAAVIPDFDGLGLGVDLVTKHSNNPTDYWGAYHHILGHNLLCAVLFSIVACALSSHRLKTTSLVFLSYHLHLLGDLLGARGPDGDQWPIPYLLPFTDSIQWVWSGQWYLNAWPNFVITAMLLAFTFYFAWRRGISPLEFLSEKSNLQFVQVLRNRFGEPKNL